MKTKKASALEVGDSIYMDDAPGRPRKVTAVYPLGEENLGIEVEGVKRVILAKQDMTLLVWEDHK